MQVSARSPASKSAPLDLLMVQMGSVRCQDVRFGSIRSPGANCATRRPVALSVGDRSAIDARAACTLCLLHRCTLKADCHPMMDRISTQSRIHTARDAGSPAVGRRPSFSSGAAAASLAALAGCAAAHRVHQALQVEYLRLRPGMLLQLLADAHLHPFIRAGQKCDVAGRAAALADSRCSYACLTRPFSSRQQPQLEPRTCSWLMGSWRAGDRPPCSVSSAADAKRSSSCSSCLWLSCSAFSAAAASLAVSAADGRSTASVDSSFSKLDTRLLVGWLEAAARQGGRPTWRRRRACGRETRAGGPVAVWRLASGGRPKTANPASHVRGACQQAHRAGQGGSQGGSGDGRQHRAGVGSWSAARLLCGLEKAAVRLAARRTDRTKRAARSPASVHERRRPLAAPSGGGSSKTAGHLPASPVLTACYSGCARVCPCVSAPPSHAGGKSSASKRVKV